MAASAPIRLPWRIITRSTAANPLVPASRHLGIQQPVNPRRTAAPCRYASDITPPPPESQKIEAETSSAPNQASISLPNDESSNPTASATQSKELESANPLNDEPDSTGLDFRLPRSVQAVYLRPLRRQAQYGVPSCDLQLRSYSVRNLEFFCDFALRAAYYLGLPVSGPIPLPRITERWTVPRSSFIFKKSQENFDRRTVRRLIQIKDGNPETVEVWLAFLRKHAYYGIGMKANVFAFSKLGVGKAMDIEMEQMKDKVDDTWEQVGIDRSRNRGKQMTTQNIMEFINKENFRSATHGDAPMTRPPAPF